MTAFRVTAKYTYALTHTEEVFDELEIKPANLHIGMVLARDVLSGTGLLLLRRGVTLDEDRIASVKRYYQIDPPTHGIFVQVTG